jgi:hypothetical protein
MSSFKACPRQCELEYFRHWKPHNQSVHLIAGAAYATGLETARRAFYSDKKQSSDAIAEGLAALLHSYGDFACPPESAKSAERTAGAFEFYFSRYPLEFEEAVPVQLDGGKLGVEFSFSEPLDILHPETGDPLLYVGRLDMLCDYAGGVYGLDDKTTSQLGATWPKQWDLRSQFTGYAWGCAKAGIPLNGFLVRGVSILKTKYDTMQAITYRPEWMIERWYENLNRSLKSMIRMWEDGYFDYNLDNSCGGFGGCMFRQICLSKNPDPWLEGSFEQRVWDSVNRTNILLKDIT